VPRITAWRKRSRAELPALKAPKGAPAEAYRTVRTNLLFMAKDGEIKTVGITSPATGEGKTTTAANLAVSLAQAEKRVIVMSCDCASRGCTSTSG
jgi:Mrp family chromosome partitioning ATPase